MPVYRPEIEALAPYEVGRPITEVAREVGLEPGSIIRLTANETPFGPFPGVAEAALEAIENSNRYPDNDAWDLSHALAEDLGVSRSNLIFGNGSTALLVDSVNAVGGPGTNVVYGWPSFIMYRFAAVWAGSGSVEVPLTPEHKFDLDQISDAIDRHTRVVFICNPNNPTGTLLAHDDVAAFVRSVPESVLVVIDEAYHDFVDAGGHQSAIPLAVASANLLVLRTFSKIYGLAGHRIGYGIASDDLIAELRKAQQPLTVSSVAQAAARASLGQTDELRRRSGANRAGRHHLMGVMGERGLDYARSQTNFVFFKMPSEDSRLCAAEFTSRGVIIRPMSGGWMRVTVGSPEENEKFVRVLDEVIDSVSD